MIWIGIALLVIGAVLCSWAVRAERNRIEDIAHPAIIVMLVLGMLMIAFGVILGGIAITHAHDAPSGWRYPQDCCGGSECRPIECSTAEPRADGSVSWLGLIFQREMVRLS